MWLRIQQVPIVVPQSSSARSHCPSKRLGRARAAQLTHGLRVCAAPLYLFQEGSPYQLRERYVGEWVGGQRDGRGTFYYASGAPHVHLFPFRAVLSDKLFLLAVVRN